MEKFTVTQAERIGELNGSKELIEAEFETKAERDQAFRKAEKELVRESRAKIKSLLDEKHITQNILVGRSLEDWLMGEGFTKVVTPTIITRDMLAKMTMRELQRITGEPVKIFERGSCFRKESQGAQHMNEFTMLNCVELAAIAEGGQLEEMKRLARCAMEALQVPEDEYEFVVEESTVYGHTLDIEINGMEVASGSYGPHFLDAQWGVFDTWVGIGFGIERLTMALNKSKTIKRYGGSIAFIDGQPLNV